MRYRVRKSKPAVEPLPDVGASSPPVVAAPPIAPAPVVSSATDIAQFEPMFRIRKRRGRTPSYIPDPWSDLEWENHPEAQDTVRRNPAGMTLEEIGRAMNITRERVRQIEVAALRKIREGVGSDITVQSGFMIAIQACPKCGEEFVRGTGRQALCDACDAIRKRKRRRRPPFPYDTIDQGYQQPTV